MVNEGAAEGLPAAEPAATTTRRPTGTHAESVTECPASSRDDSPAGRDGPSRDRDGPFRVLVAEPATGSRKRGRDRDAALLFSALLLDVEAEPF
jgi:hypothetical protein